MNAHDAFKHAETFVPEEPTPLVRQIPPGERYPVEALGPLREAVEAVQDITQAPPAIGAQSALAVASLAAQALADVETLGGRAPLSIFALTVAQSGERKSTCDRLLMRAVRDFERDLGDAAKLERAGHGNRLAVWEERRKAILRSAKHDADAARDDLDELGPPPEEPLLPFIVSTEPTFEGIAKHLAVARPALGIFSDEGGAFIGGHAMKEENRLRTVAALSSMWDGSPVNRWRAGDGVEVHHGRRLAVHLMAQPIAASALLADPVANGQGFLARFLVTEPPSTIGTRMYREPSPQSKPALDGFAGRIRDILRRELPLREGTRNELDPPIMRLDPDAKGVLAAFFDHVEQAQRDGGELEAVRPFASKAAEHAARLAGVLTLFGTPDAQTVRGETMADAVKLANFYVSEARRLADAATVSAEIAEAERLRTWLFEKWGEPFISAADVAQRGPFQETDRARRLLGVLDRHGWVHRVEGGAPVRGKRRREAWRLHGRAGS